MGGSCSKSASGATGSTPTTTANTPRPSALERGQGGGIEPIEYHHHPTPPVRTGGAAPAGGDITEGGSCPAGGESASGSFPILKGTMVEAAPMCGDAGTLGRPMDGHKRWVRLQTSGRSPSPRSGHDVVVIGPKAYLFGGCGGEHDQITCLNDVYVFDLELHRWDEVKVRGDVPLPRASFGMCAGPTPDSVIVAGGTGVEMDSLRADVVEFDCRTRTWSKVLTDSEETPCKFYGQSVCTYGDVLLLFGGSTGLHYTNDLYEYNVCSNRWKKLVTTGRKPSPRYKHQAVVVGDKMYVIGGGCFKPEQSIIDLYCLNLTTLVWEDVAEMLGDVPKARVAHSCSYDAMEQTIYLWGGFTSELSRLQDFYAYHCPTNSWSAINVPVVPQQKDGELVVPPARAFHSAVFFKGSLYVFSGANGDVRYSDVWRYQVRSSPPSLTMLSAHQLRVTCPISSKRNLELILPAEVLQGLMLMNEYADRLC